MPVPRVRFTIQGLMIAVAGVVALLGLQRMFPILPFLLFCLVVLSIPAAAFCLIAALPRVPERRVPWRAGSWPPCRDSPSWAGWLWAFVAISILLPRSRAGAAEAASRKAHAEFWGLNILMTVTAVCLAAFVARIVVTCVRRRRDLMSIAAVYACAMAFSWLFCFALLGLEIFY